MNHQEWFERFKTRLRFDENKLYYQPKLLLEEWKQFRFAAIRASLFCLPSLQRKILRLILFKDFSEREVAQKLGISKTSVHREKWKAFDKLSEQFFLKLLVRSG